MAEKKKKYSWNVRRDMEASGYSGSKHDIPPGFRVFRESCPRRLASVSPGMQGARTGRLVFRPFPQFDEDGAPKPTRLEQDGWYPSDWIIAVPVCQFVGTVQEAKFSCVLYAGGPDEDLVREAKNNNPYLVAFNRAARAAKNSALPDLAWAEWFDSDTPYDRKPLRPMSLLYLVQGLTYEKSGEDGTQFVFQNNNRPDGSKPTDPAQIAVLSNSVGRMLVALSTIPSSEDADPHDMERGYRVGDVVSVGSKEDGAGPGRFIYVFDQAKPQQRTGTEKLKVLSETEMIDMVNRGQSMTGKHFTAGMQVNYQTSREKSIPARLADVDNVRKLTLPWEDVVHVPEWHEIALWMAQAFADNAKFLRWAWDGHREFFTDAVQKVLNASKSVSVVDPEPSAEDSDESDDLPEFETELGDEESTEEPEDSEESEEVEEAEEDEPEEGYEEAEEPEDAEVIDSDEDSEEPEELEEPEESEEEDEEEEDEEYGGGDVEEAEEEEEDVEEPVRSVKQGGKAKKAPPAPVKKAPPAPAKKAPPAPAKKAAAKKK